MKYGSTLKTPLSFLFLPFSSSGSEMSGSGVEDAARWESRHLLQELLNTEIQVYIEPEKNCTEPGKTRTGLRRAERPAQTTSGGRVWASGQRGGCDELRTFCLALG